MIVLSSQLCISSELSTVIRRQERITGAEGAVLGISDRDYPRSDGSSWCYTSQSQGLSPAVGSELTDQQT